MRDQYGFEIYMREFFFVITRILNSWITWFPNFTQKEKKMDTKVPIHSSMLGLLKDMFGLLI